MNLTARINLLFFKNQCIKVIITDINKRVKIHIVRIEDATNFNIGERTFVIDYDNVFMSNGLPTYFYYMENPVSISKEALEKSLEPLDPEIASRFIEVSSSKLYTAIEETISKKIIRYAEDGDKRIINAIYMMGGITILVVAGIGYFNYMTVEKILQFLNEKEQILQMIYDNLRNTTGN